MEEPPPGLAFGLVSPSDRPPIIAKTVDYAAGEVKEVAMHDGSKILLRKVDESMHDPTDKQAALRLLTEAHEKGQFITGLMYIDGSRDNLAEAHHLGSRSIASLQQDSLRPNRESLTKLMAGMY